MMQPLLSIIIPTFNRREMTLRAIRSIKAAQGSYACTIVVVDDGSDEPFKAPAINTDLLTLKVIRFQKNLGAAAARNAGLDATSTPLVSFLDSDDQLSPNSLDNRINFAINNDCLKCAGKTTITACGWFDVTDQDIPIRSRLPRATTGEADFLRGCWFSPGSCIIASKDLFDLPGMRFDPSLRRLEDYDLFAKMALIKGSKLKVIHDIGARIEHSVGRPSNAVFRACEIIQKSFKESLRKGEISPIELRAVTAYLNYEAAKFHRQNGQAAKCAWSLVSSFLNAPRLKMYPGPGWRIQRI